METAQSPESVQYCTDGLGIGWAKMRVVVQFEIRPPRTLCQSALPCFRAVRR
jgi:hypothetical protein